MSGAVFLAAVVLAACGGTRPASPGVASLGFTTTSDASVPPTSTPTASSAQGTSASSYTDDVAYAKCMRAHGESDFPDPNSRGLFEHVPSRNTPEFTAAEGFCHHLLPNNGEPTAAQLQTLTANGLKYTSCMRRDGVPDFPDPTVAKTPFGSEGVIFSDKGLNPEATSYKQAQKSCQQVLFGSAAS
jgi:hypothetical protein